MSTAQKILIIIVLLAVALFFIFYKPAEPEIIIEKEAQPVEKPAEAAPVKAVQAPSDEKPAEKPESKPKCSATIISPSGKFCYEGTAAENNNFVIAENKHIERDVCTLFSIYPSISYNKSLDVKLSITASDDLDTYIVDNYKTSFERCSKNRPVRYIKFYNLDDPVKDELAIYPGYYLLFETNKEKGSDVNFSIDYSANVREQCGCEE